ncbi:MAG: DUF4445 domain-containing protein [Phycisphaerae bacterium]|nr:DUF4445 domain-containing protein [Phycisphaerae bacterium]
MKHYQVHFQPDDKQVTIHHGATLLEAAGLVGIILSNPCGGAGRCGKCKVRLMPSKKEVFACQYAIEHDIEVFIPDSSRFFKQKILEHGITQDVLVNPAVQKIFTNNPVSGLEELSKIITRKLREPCYIDKDMEDKYVKNQTSSNHAGITAVLINCITTGTDLSSDTISWRLVNIEEGDTTEKLFGLAVDIGTTTVVARLINLQTSQVIATVSTGNPQAHYGIDVISRIGFTETDAGGATLHETIISCLNNLCDEAARQAGIETNHIYEIVIAGNTTMNHLLLKYPVRQLGQAPYQAHSLLSTNQKASKVGLYINPAGHVYTPANIAGFVGSDTVAAALACGLDSTDAVTLLVDIGTNGEIVLGTKDHLWAASCAAGPALEGAGITFGSRAQSGAIERVIYDQNDIDIDVIGQTKAATICGSGLIDAVAVLLDIKIIDSTGRFTEPDELGVPMVPEKIKKRVTRYQNEPAFVLTGKDNSETAVLLTQKDVRQIQLAKAAIQAGILLLLKKAGYDQIQIQQILLAGAFGNYIQKENAIRIGLLPNIAVEKIHFVGNAAGSGAQMILINRATRKLAEQLARQIEYLEIAHQTEFQEVFSECLLFPKK